MLISGHVERGLPKRNKQNSKTQQGKQNFITAHHRPKKRPDGRIHLIYYYTVYECRQRHHTRSWISFFFSNNNTTYRVDKGSACHVDLWVSSWLPDQARCPRRCWWWWWCWRRRRRRRSRRRRRRGGGGGGGGWGGGEFSSRTYPRPCRSV